MAGVTEQEFFASIRSALTDRGQPVSLPDDLEIARVIRPEQDRLAVFAARIEEAGMHAYRVPDEATLIDKIVQIMDAAGGRSAILPEEDLPARDQIIARLKDKGIAVADASDRDASFKVDFGITGVVAAVAETASLCIMSGNGRRQLASLAVPNHIGIVRADQVLPDLLDWAAHLPADMPANTVLISGPSKTADIEMIIITGVHGPGEEHIIVLG